MPNWCQNKLKILGEEDDIKEFREEAASKKQMLSLQKLCPIPLELKLTEDKNTLSEEEKERRKKKYGTTDWYDWCIDNWGTKWDIDKDSLIEEFESENELIYYFDTAWGPPREALTTISKDFPNLTFLLDYEEPGVCFKGISKITYGTIEDYEISY